MDNCSDGIAIARFTACVTHFGRLLKSLREGRALSQERLAAEAGVARFTIQRSEQSERCNLRRSNALALFTALQRFRPPISEDEAAKFLRLAGLDPALSTPPKEHVARAAASVNRGMRPEMVDRVNAMIGPGASTEMLDRIDKVLHEEAHSEPTEARRQSSSSQSATDPDDATAHDIIARLIQERGAHNVLIALEGLCAAWAIDPPPRRTHENLARLGVWAVVHESKVEDRVVRKFYPTSPRKPDEAKRKPKVS